MSTPETIDTTAPVPEKKSRWEDYIDVFFSPTELFERRKDDKLAPALITLLVLSFVFYWVLLPAVQIVQRAMMTPEQQAQIAKIGAALKIFTIIGSVTAPIMYLIMVALAAACLWLLARLVDTDPSFHDMMVVTTYAGFIALLGSIAAQVAIMVHGEVGLDVFRHTSFGVLRFVDYKNMPKVLVPILARIDIFKIWQAAVWAIGFRVMTGASKSKSAFVAGAVWLLAAVPGIIGSFSKLGQAQLKTGG
jgi:hypothetical protein